MSDTRCLCAQILRTRVALGILAVSFLALTACDAKGPVANKAFMSVDASLPTNHNTEAYDRIVDNPFQLVSQSPLSTFSSDVDTASYSNVRRFLLQEGKLPPKDAVRIEEMINYFTYDYPAPAGNHPVAITPELTACPWNPKHRLLRIGVQTAKIDPREMPSRNLVFLVDVSGSMAAPNRLPLLKQSLSLLVDQLSEGDRVSIVVYAGRAGLELPATPGHEKARIKAVIGRLEASGSTNGGEGIVLAYRLAQENFIAGGVNRVIIGTDGDFNVGVTNQGDLTRLIEEKRKSGVFLTVLGFGMGNLKDSTLEKLAHYGNGHYAYIDSLDEARRLFVEQGAALTTVAKDVKFQVEFNPTHVAAYRLIGYENRILAHQDFNNDQKDAGDMGSGHTCTALYELVPAGEKIDVPGIDPLKYQQIKPAGQAQSDEWLTIKLRYKDPDAEVSKLLTVPVKGADLREQPSPDCAFASAVAAFGMILRDSPYKENAKLDAVAEAAAANIGDDPGGHRAEFGKLIQKTGRLKK